MENGSHGEDQVIRPRFELFISQLENVSVVFSYIFLTDLPTPFHEIGGN